MGRKPTFENDPRRLVSLRESVINQIEKLEPEGSSPNRKLMKLLPKLKKYSVCMDESGNCKKCEDRDTCEWVE